MSFLFYDKKKIIIKFTKIDSGVYYFHESQCAFIFHQNKSDNRRFEARLGLFLQKLIHLIITILSFRRTLRKNWVDTLPFVPLTSRVLRKFEVYSIFLLPVSMLSLMVFQQMRMSIINFSTAFSFRKFVFPVPFKYTWIMLSINWYEFSTPQVLIRTSEM